MNRIITLFLCCIISIASLAQKDRTQIFDSLLSSLHEKNMFNGNVLIAENGKAIFEKSYGIADESDQRPLNTKSVFELASVSKQFTAMAILLLQKEKKLSIEDPITKYIPELDFMSRISIKNLVHHTSGLPDYMELFDEHWDKSQFAVNQDIVDMLVKQQVILNFEPGEEFEYSNTGYALLGLIIEKASGMDYGSYLKKKIFKPLGMKNTQVYRSRYAPEKIKNYALGYVENDFGVKVSPDSFGKEYFSYYLDGIVGDGMVSSNLQDLLKWDQALYGDKLINDADRNLIFSSVETELGGTNSYGFGWVLSTHPKYGEIVYHSGGWAGYSTFIERHLDNNKTIIVLSNNATERTTLSIVDLRKILYNEVIVSEQLVAAQYNEAELKVFEGVYKNEDFPLDIKVFVENAVLMAQATGQDAFPLESFENNTFTFELAQIKMVFSPKTNEMLFSQGANKVLFNR